MFLESILFLQKLKNFKNSVALFWWLNRGSPKSHASAARSHVDFGDLFASEGSSREGYTEIFAAQLATPFVGRPSNRKKHLENFSQFCLWVFWRLDLATCWRLTSVVKIACLAKTGSVFPRTFCDYSLSLNWISPKHSVSLSTTSIVALVHLQIFKKKVWALILSPHISYFELHFREYLCWYFDFCYGFVSMFLGFFLFGLLKVLFPCKLVSVDGFIYFLVFVFLR